MPACEIETLDDLIADVPDLSTADARGALQYAKDLARSQDAHREFWLARLLTSVGELAKMAKASDEAVDEILDAIPRLAQQG